MNSVLTDAEKAEFVTYITDYGADCVDHLFSVIQYVEQAVLHSEQVQAWKKDAERYRHLRDQGELGPHDVFNAWWLSENGYPQTLDAAIDAAMEKQP